MICVPEMSFKCFISFLFDNCLVMDHKYRSLLLNLPTRNNIKYLKKNIKSIFLNDDNDDIFIKEIN